MVNHLILSILFTKTFGQLGQTGPNARRQNLLEVIEHIHYLAFAGEQIERAPSCWICLRD